MKLRQALRLGDQPCVAFVGAGGKTTAMFHLARQFLGPVLVTASTHLAEGQLSLADTHFVIGNEDDLASVPLGDGVNLFTGAMGKDGRTSGLNPASLEALHRLSKKRDIPLLIEADGARMRPLKAPAAHEPAIPDFAEVLVIVAGLSGIGRPLRDEWVHRPERFSELSGIKIGEPVTAEGLVRVLLSRRGGLKNAPLNARRVVLLTQADDERRQAVAQGVAARLLQSYGAVLAASLEQETDLVVSAAYGRVAGVVLAAGSSERLGGPKQLLEWRGEPFVRRVAKVAVGAGLSPVVVVLGAYSEEIRPVFEDLPVLAVENAAWEQGQSTSLKAGLRSLPGDTEAVVFLLVDQPQMTETLLRKLVDTHATTLAPIIAPEVRGQRGNPVLFDKVTFADLEQLEGDVGGRGVFAKHPITWVPWLDEAIALDVDTLEDYHRLLNYED